MKKIGKVLGILLAIYMGMMIIVGVINMNSLLIETSGTNEQEQKVTEPIEQKEEIKQEEVEETTIEEVSSDIELITGNYVGGEDIKEGKYDVFLNNECGLGTLMITHTDGMVDLYYMGTEDYMEGYVSNEIKNVRIDKGAIVEVSTGLNILLKEK